MVDHCRSRLIIPIGDAEGGGPNRLIFKADPTYISDPYSAFYYTPIGYICQVGQKARKC